MNGKLSRSAPRPKRVLLASRFWHADIIEGVTRHAAEHGWHLNLEMLTFGMYPETWHGDGIILQSPSLLIPRQKKQLSGDIPAVALSLSDPEIRIPRVGINNEIAGRMAAEHFLDRCFTNFAVYAIDMPVDSTANRLHVFRKTLEEAGFQVIDVSSESKAKQPNSDMWSSRIKKLRRKLIHARKPLAVFALDDMSAADVVEACQMESLTIPDQVAVLGMLDIAIYRNVTGVALSSIKVDFDAHTRIACDLLARLMNGEDVSSTPILLNPTGIAERESTETIATHIPEVTRALQFIRENYQEPITAHQIARAAGASHSKLCRQFEADLGEAPYAVLCKIRIEYAKRMISGSDQNLDSIAELCGFGDRVNLHRNFVKYTGVSPGAYRKSLRQ